MNIILHTARHGSRPNARKVRNVYICIVRKQKDAGLKLAQEQNTRKKSHPNVTHSRPRFGVRTSIALAHHLLLHRSRDHHPIHREEHLNRSHRRKRLLRVAQVVMLKKGQHLLTQVQRDLFVVVVQELNWQ